MDTTDKWIVIVSVYLTSPIWVPLLIVASGLIWGVLVAIQTFHSVHRIKVD